MLKKIDQLVRYGVCLLAVALCLELLARCYYFCPPTQFDSAVGRYVNPQNITMRNYSEGFGDSHWLEHGVRKSKSSQESGRRILVVGDSFTEAMHVNDDQTFCHALNELLPDETVLNIGYNGSSVADYLALAERYLATFHPDLVVIQLRDSDFSDAFVDRHDRAYFSVQLDKSSHLTFHPDRLSGEPLSKAKLLVSRSAALSLAFRQFRELLNQEKETKLFQGAQESATSHQECTPEQLESALDGLERAYGKKLVLLYLPPFSTVASASATEKGITAFSVRQGVPLANFREQFVSLQERKICPYGFSNSRFNSGHLNPSGHKAVAELLHQVILGAKSKV